MTPTSARHPRPRPKVLSVCETAQGGVGRYQESLRCLKAHGFVLDILLPRQDIHVLSDQTGLIGFERDRRGPKALARLLIRFLALRDRLRPDLYFFNSTFTLPLLLVLRLLQDRTPAVYCAHCWAVNNYAEGSIKWRVVRALERRLCGFADLVINVSSGDAELARRLGYRGRHVVIENAVPDLAPDDPATAPAESAGGDADGIDLLFVGRFDHQKGLDILLAAFERARARAPHLCLHLVGEPVRGKAPPRLPEGVVLHGWVSADRLDACYKAADALVVPSRWEGLPLVLPEALRNGTPVLVSDRSEMGRLVTHGKDGMVFELDETALGNCLATLKIETLRAMRPAARASFERRFALDRFGREMAVQLATLTDRQP